MTNLNERIAKIIEYSTLSSSEFADEVDVQRSSVSHITSGRNKPSLDFLIKVKNRFPELQWEWLVTGEGEMTENSATNKENLPESPTTPTPTSLPDLFSLIGDEDFGQTESEDRITSQEKAAARESQIPGQLPTENHLRDSQGLEKNALQTNNDRVMDVQDRTKEDKVKRIVLFFESGKFESFEP